jgi:hypothetical protein
MERGTSGVALASTNWCAVVVLPQRLPATMLKENSAGPPKCGCCAGRLLNIETAAAIFSEWNVIYCDKLKTICHSNAGFGIEIIAQHD